ncbi:MAG: Flavodoxin reductase [Candidatus Adlerbacteria bacterium GW2011_GWA1_54_10]|uniref:Flavodoxin reductase n=3 Tax=Candidatus Adleribacteriota TaxID=1752736 RepID=A0A0G1XYP2_9BACT|nr:MAG: Flavodoxin reductase [Candidatus Adlerbacteria bacterium GW2011_GWA1_54_10]KKW37346.1 MAG: Flavodoxin reductase [Candidatus Adlerbacteria bacterium GW2011_GWB1_54_7]
MKRYSIMRLRMNNEYRPYIVYAKRRETPTVVELSLEPQDGVRPDFIPGQFVNISLPEVGPEAKSYTIASTPLDELIVVAVREAGDFSQALCGRKVGEEVLLSEPLGYFYPEDAQTPRVFVAGGIGVMPFVSIARAGSGASTILLYSNRAAHDVPFHAMLSELERENKNFSVKHFITRENSPLHGAVNGRIGPEHLARALQDYPEGNFFLCGSIIFVRDMRLVLKDLFVPEERIYTESFF